MSLISAMEKLTGYDTPVPFKMMDCLRAHQEEAPDQSIITHLHTPATSISAYPMAVIQDTDRTGRPQTASPRAFYF